MVFNKGDVYDKLNFKRSFFFVRAVFQRLKATRSQTKDCKSFVVVQVVVLFVKVYISYY